MDRKKLSMKSKKKCPKCGSSRVVSIATATNHNTDHLLIHHTVHNVHKNPYLAMAAGAGLLLTKAMEYFSDKWKCSKCSKTFS
jgi:ribosomal protein S27AE